MDKTLYTNTFNFIMSEVIKLLPNMETDKKPILEFYVRKICNDITIKTNRNSFPIGLKYLVVELALDAFEIYKADNTDDKQVIQSMSETGRTVNFGDSDTWKTKYQILINKQLNDNEKLINRYRLLYRTRCPYEKD